MATQARYRIGFAPLFAIIFAWAAPPVDAQQPPSKEPIIVEVHRTMGQLVLTLKPNPAPGKDILWGLGELVKQRGTNYPVVGLVDDNARISDLDQVAGIAAKAGFNNIRTFIVRRGVGMGIMAEFKFCSALPISTNPPVDSTCESTP